MLTGPLVTPPAVAVMTAVPVMGLPCTSVPLQTTNVESHTPPHTRPAGEMVATVVSEELKVKVAMTAVLAEFTADVVSGTPFPAGRGAGAGRMSPCASFLLEDLDPPQPPRKPAIRMSA